MLADEDFEAISVARFARAAGCSVGGFYGRFSDKRLFLEFLILETFRQATSRVESALGSAAARGLRFENSACKIAELISGQFRDDEFAGMVRVAVKLGLSDLKSRAPFDAYREAATERAVALLTPLQRRGGEDRTREAVQAALGILTDAVVSGAGRLRPGSARMNEALTAVIIGLAGGKSAVKSKREKRPEAIKPADRPARSAVREDNPRVRKIIKL